MTKILLVANARRRNAEAGKPAKSVESSDATSENILLVSHDEDLPDPTVPPTISNTSVTHQQEEELIASGDYQRRPFCAEIIRSKAIICRFCQRDIQGL